MHLPESILGTTADPHLSPVDQHGYEMGTTAAEIRYHRILSADTEYIKFLKTLLFQ